MCSPSPTGHLHLGHAYAALFAADAADGGRFLVRGGKVHPLENAQDIERFVVIEFPSVEAARGFYDSADYQRILPARTDNAATDMFIVEGAA